MPWNPFAKKPTDIELPLEGKRDKRLPRKATAPIDTLKSSMDSWKKLNTETAMEGLENYKK